jgi:poly(hydroxyalkanoate) depolymerase family esterase
MHGLDQDEMAEALNLTRAGRLTEATELLQRTLGAAPTTYTTTGASPRTPAPPAPEPTFGAAADRSSRLRRLTDTLRRSLGRDFAMPQGLHTQLPHSDLLPRQAPPPGSLGSGELIEGSYSNGSDARRYRVYVPPECTGRGAPVVVMLHGGTQAVLDYAAGTGMNPLADQQQFLVVYPEQDARANPMRYWNWFRPEDQRSGTGEPALIAGITEQVVRDYDADSSRVFIAGFSAGAAMAAVIAATYPELYAAAGVHSGLPYAAAHDVPSAFALMRGDSVPSRRGSAIATPLIVFHGDRDDIVDVVNASHLQRQRTGANPSVTKTAVHGQVPGGHAFTQTRYARDGDVLLEEWIVHGGAHAWFGGTPGCSYTDSLGPDASAEMVRFFFGAAEPTSEGRVRR